MIELWGVQDGARLTHSHDRQYSYVLQSLTLWREIAQDMFRLWTLAEEDLLDPSTPYALKDTGQGLNRVQECPRISKAMREIVHDVQTECSGGWVGSSVVHLGDNNVPNSLIFIDKYNQVSRFLQPIVLCIDKLPTIIKDPGVKTYIEGTFGGIEKLTMDILLDFFKGGFDGSGADNFFDAGSCIDGRLTVRSLFGPFLGPFPSLFARFRPVSSRLWLTFDGFSAQSAWNWCSKLEQKEYFPVFLLTGFTGFDGEFG